MNQTIWKLDFNIRNNKKEKDKTLVEDHNTKPNTVLQLKNNEYLLPLLSTQSSTQLDGMACGSIGSF